ncbi:MAG: M48 family metallopeptidase [Vampirovibrionales bacterium]|nr:M48 family metallopeptidase [Vampirovibrionales bacterium]
MPSMNTSTSVMPPANTLLWMDLPFTETGHSSDVFQEMSHIPVQVERTTARQTASGRWGNQGMTIRVPSQWSHYQSQSAIDSLKAQLLATLQQDIHLYTKALSDVPRITLLQTAALSCYISRLNFSTLKVAFNKARIGAAVSTRLAQANVKTGVITVSKHCLNNVPEPAIRYLALHELAHFIEANHSHRFWRLVATHEPNYRQLAKWIQAHHRLSVAGLLK